MDRYIRQFEDRGWKCTKDSTGFFCEHPKYYGHITYFGEGSEFTICDGKSLTVVNSIASAINFFEETTELHV
jgi:hypothetical protein